MITLQAYCDSVKPIIFPQNPTDLKALISRDYPRLAQGGFPGNPSALRALVCNSEEYRQKKSALEAIPFPTAELTRIISVIAHISMPIAQHKKIKAGTIKFATALAFNLLEGSGKIQAPKIRIDDWDQTNKFSLITDKLETATHVPTIMLSPQEVIISGGASAIRGTLIKTRRFVDETARLLIGVDKTALHYWSYANKESGGIFRW